MPTKQELVQLQKEEGEKDVFLGTTETFKPRPGLLVRSIPSLILPMLFIGFEMFMVLLVMSGMFMGRWEPMFFGLVLFIAVPYMVVELG